MAMAMKQKAPIKKPPSLLDKLFTKEDPYGVHKTLGVACLSSFVWRFTRPWESQMGFVSHPHLTIPTLMLHWSLNLSSFVFKIPEQRIRGCGGRIWPEYRLHALCFFSRTALAVLIRQFFYYGPESTHQQMTIYYWMNFALVIANAALADLASWSCGENSSQSIRGARLPVAVRYYFSLMQFLGTAYHMMSTNFSMVFFYAWVVQFNPFGMTLVRKNIISHEFNMTLYALELGAGIPLGYKLGHKDPYYVGPQLLGIVAGFWRMGPLPQWFPRNKYVVWTGIFALFLTVIRPIMENQDPYDVEVMTTCADLSVVIMVAYILYRQHQEEHEKEEEVDKSTKSASPYEKIPNLMRTIKDNGGGGGSDEDSATDDAEEETNNTPRELLEGSQKSKTKPSLVNLVYYFIVYFGVIWFTLVLVPLWFPKH